MHNKYLWLKIFVHGPSSTVLVDVNILSCRHSEMVKEFATHGLIFNGIRGGGRVAKEFEKMAKYGAPTKRHRCDAEQKNCVAWNKKK